MYQSGGYPIFKYEYEYRTVIQIRYLISSVNLVDIRYSNVKICQSDIQIQCQNDIFLESLNIQYQSGGYSIFKCESLPE